ncbi:MAG: tripartite tricarboxylate transporter TctB family protein, partial [Deferribacteres bacterium]|nr:tripartite tricarboxylate transporter TctB family protein [Deferribacteres bacterium]
LDAFRFFACMVVDPEVLITNRHAKVRTLEEIIADAQAKEGKQRWLGPLVGGVDHLMAVQTWDKLGIKGEWIPYEGGSDALAALMGQHGVVYVGNPVDIKGRPDLMLAVVAAPERLSEFPDVPTFLEKGYDIAEEVLWRGYAVKRGTSPKVLAYLSDLFEKISADPEWIHFISATSAQPVFFAENAFTQRVKENQLQAKKYLVMANVLQQEDVSGQRSSAIPLIILTLFVITLGFTCFFKREWITGDTVISTIIFYLSLYLYLMTLGFPSGKLGQTAGPAAMPRLWLYGLVLFSVLLIFSVIRALNKEKKIADRSVKKPLSIIALTVAYLLVLDMLGYYLSTLIFLIAGSYLISYRKHAIIISSAVGFVALSWLIFYKILQVPLPVGILFG